MTPAVDSSAREAPVPTDESTLVAPVPAENIQPEKVTQSSDDPPVVEDAGEAQSSPPNDGNPDTTVEDGIDFDDSFGPPPLPSVIPKGPLSRPVAGGPKPKPGGAKPRPK